MEQLNNANTDSDGDRLEMLRQAKQQRFDNLQQLKKDDPEQYKKGIQEHMASLRKEDPENYRKYCETNKEKIAKQNKSYRAKKKAEKHAYQPSCISFFSQEEAFEMSDLGDDR